MKWSRRSFLGTVISGCVGAAVSPSLAWPSVVRPAIQAAAFNPTRPFRVCELFAEAVGEKSGLLRIGRAGTMAPVWSAMVAPSSIMWMAWPIGAEPTGPDLVNQSDADLDVCVTVEQDGRRWHIGADGEAVCLELQEVLFASQ